MAPPSRQLPGRVRPPGHCGILDRGGDLVRSYQGTGREIKATWDGRAANGARVADGSYLAEVRVDDALGNTATASTPLTVDTVDPSGSVSPAVSGLVGGATSRAFSPDGDGWQDHVVLRVVGGEPVRAAISIRDRAGRIVWSASAPMGATPSVTWKGRDRRGRTLKDGTYRVLAKVTDAAGNRSTLERHGAHRPHGRLPPSRPRALLPAGQRLARAGDQGELQAARSCDHDAAGHRCHRSRRAHGLEGPRSTRRHDRLDVGWA